MPQQIDFDPSLDFYKALGVAKDATADDIKKQYRKLAKQYHPDSTGGDKAKETRFKEISNAYDVLGDGKKKQLYDDLRASGQGSRGRAGGPSYTYEARGGAGPGVFDLGDLFGQFFSQAQQAPPRPGGQRPARGMDDLEDRGPQLIKASDGSMIEVRGGDVHSDVRIPFDRAILGTVATVPTIDGTLEVKIPPGTASGKRLRLKGKGVPDRVGAIGHHYVTVQIDVPGDLDDEAKKLLVQLVQKLRKREPNG
jgi:molecular chaperone DnaJ